MNNASVHEFSRIPSVKVQRSSFDRSSRHMTTINAGLLYPVFLDEVLPGDTFSMSPKVFARMTTQLCPTMSNIYLDLQFFYVPTRLVWDNFKKFMGEQKNPGDSIDFMIPQARVPNSMDYTDTSFDGARYNKNLVRYFGLPLARNASNGEFVKSAGYMVNALPLRCYNLIWNEWYRDQNLQESAFIDTSDSMINFSLESHIERYPLRPRGKRHDYFTSCLPWPQKGEMSEVNISLGDTAPVVGNGLALGLTDGTDNAGLAMKSSAAGMLQDLFGDAVGTTTSASGTLSGAVGVTNDETKSGLVAKLSAASPISINSLRQAFQIQRYMEQAARGGTRYVELVKSFFGVDVPDLRVQRPEYLGGSTFNIIESTVPQTSESDATPQGNLAAYSVFSGAGSTWTKSFSEHGYILGLASIRSDLLYQSGINRLWLRKSRFDFYWPTFAHLGEQAVTNKEIYACDELSSANVHNQGIFGYQERYAEYRYKPNLITGRLVSSIPNNLDVWHLAQNFESLPMLNSEFIEERPPISRNLALSSDLEPEFIADFYFGLKCARPMPVYSVPGLIDHF